MFACEILWRKDRDRGVEVSISRAFDRESVCAVRVLLAIVSCCLFAACSEENDPNVEPDAALLADATNADAAYPDAAERDAEVAADATSTACVGAAAQLAVIDRELEFFWIGQRTEVALVDFEIVQPGCLELAVRADVQWLSPLLDVSARRVAVVLEGARVLGGAQSGRVELFDARDPAGAALASFTVGLRAVGGADPALERKVLVIGYDGVRADSYVAADTPQLDRLMVNAAYSFEASAQLASPPLSGPGWTTVFSGVDSDKHNVRANEGYADRDRRYPSFLLRARERLGVKTAAAVNWSPLVEDILEDDALDHRFTGTDPQVVTTMSDWLANAECDVCFVHFNDPDAAGHASGFTPLNPSYLAAISASDVRSGELLNAIVERRTVAREQWMIILVSDHGGSGTSHSCLGWECREIPLIAAGPSVVAGELAGAVLQADVHPTVLDFLGVPIDPAWNLDGLVLGTVREPTCWERDLRSVLGAELAADTTLGAGADLSASCGGFGEERAYRWTAPAAGVYTFDLTGSERDFDTVLSVLADQAMCTGAELACNDDRSGSQSAVQVTLESGESVILVVDSSDAPGSFQLNGEALAACPDGELGDLVGRPVSTGTVGATGASFFASCALSGRDVLFTWTAPATGRYRLDSEGSDYDTVLSVLDGRCAGDELACNDDAIGYQSVVEVELIAGQQVTIVLAGYNGASGHWRLNIEAL